MNHFSSHAHISSSLLNAYNRIETNEKQISHFVFGFFFFFWRISSWKPCESIFSLAQAIWRHWVLPFWLCIFFFTPWLFLRRIHNNNITFQFVFKAPQNGDDEVFLVILSFNIYVVKETHFFFLFSSSRVPTIKRLFHFLSFLLIKKKGRGGKWPRPRQGESRSRRNQNYIFLFHCFFFSAL